MADKYLSKKYKSRIINFIDQLNLVHIRKYILYTDRKNESFWPKKLSHCMVELKFDPTKWVNGNISVNLTPNVESIWLSMLSQFDSQCWAILTLNVELIWLSKLSQFNSQCWESIWLSMLSQFDLNIFQLHTFPGQILVPPMSQLFMSKWLKSQFFFSV